MRLAARWLALVALVAVQAALAQPDSKILRITFQAAETGFDPARVHDYYSQPTIEAIYDTLLTYDYLARPAKLVPNAAAMPEVSADGRTFSILYRNGVFSA